MTIPELILSFRVGQNPDAWNIGPFTPAVCPAAIERHVRHARSHRAEHRTRECRRHGRSWHDVHTSSAGLAGVRHGDFDVLRRVQSRARFPRVDRDDTGPRRERDVRGPGVRQPRYRQHRQSSGNAAQDRRQRGVRRTGLRGGDGTFREAATRRNLREHEGQRQVMA